MTGILASGAGGLYLLKMVAGLGIYDNVRRSDASEASGTSGNSLAQNYAEPQYHGRVMSYVMMGIGFASLGTFLAGAIVEVIGVEWSIGGMAIQLVAVSAALLIFTPLLRELE